MTGLRYRVEKLGKNHDRTSFSCGDPDLDRYFKAYAGQDVKRDLSMVRVAVDTQNSYKVVGFYTLSSTAIKAVDFPKNLRRRLPYEAVPGTLIGRLAVDKSYQRQGLDTGLLMDALLQIADNRHIIASAFAVIDAKNDKAREFYEKFGFVSFPGEPLRMYVHMKTLDKALEQIEAPYNHSFPR